MRPFVHASVFSGIGAAELAAAWMGWRNAFHCEIQEFPRRVLEYWFPNSESYEDITKTDFSKWRGRIDILTGGFPCQPFSLAGKRGGADDDRYLWPEMLRAVREIQPAWVVGENVAGLLTMVQPGEEADMGGDGSIFEENHIYRKEQDFTIEEICRGLEREGYAVQPFVVPACAVGAPHRRDRVWVVARRNDARAEDKRGRKDDVLPGGAAAHTDSHRRWRRTDEQEPLAEREGTPYIGVGGEEGAAAVADGEGLEGRDEPRHEEARRAGLRLDAAGCREEDGWRLFPTQPPVCGRDDGLPFDVDCLALSFAAWRRESIKAYGNAWVPQVAYEIFRAIEEAEATSDCEDMREGALECRNFTV